MISMWWKVSGIVANVRGKFNIRIAFSATRYSLIALSSLGLEVAWVLNLFVQIPWIKSYSAVSHFANKMWRGRKFQRLQPNNWNKKTSHLCCGLGRPRFKCSINSCSWVHFPKLTHKIGWSLIRQLSTPRLHSNTLVLLMSPRTMGSASLRWR